MPKLVRRKDGSVLVDGLLPFEDLLKVIRLPATSREESHTYSTVGGFVLAHMGRIPEAGEAFQMGGFRIEIVAMDGHRIDKVLVVPLTPPGSAPQ